LDFDLNNDQRAILEAVEALLEQHAGAARAIELQPKGEYDASLDAALADAGFSDVGRDPDMGGLEATLVVEAVARAGGVVAIGAEAMVAPMLRDEPLPTPIALATAGQGGAVRYAASARSLLVLGDREARWVALEPGDCAPVRSNFGYPMGRVSAEGTTRGDGLGVGSAARLHTAWQLAIAAEAVGCMEAALAQTVGYLKERRQFGRAIGSFQAVQHRLAECAIHVEGSRWLVREAAYQRAPTEGVATAAAFALSAAGRIFSEMHQLSGAIGFTREHDLHVWSMRLQALRLELGGVAAHRRAIVAARWGGVGS
jgi:alkylation response protein AidB-like acyl-CoA dehydrogenase